MRHLRQTMSGYLDDDETRGVTPPMIGETPEDFRSRKRAENAVAKTLWIVVLVLCVGGWLLSTIR